MERQRVAGVEREERQFLAVDRGEASQAAAAHDHQSFLGRLFFIGAIDQLAGPDAADRDQAAPSGPAKIRSMNLRQRQIAPALAVASAAACADDQPRCDPGRQAHARVKALSVPRLEDAIVGRRIVADRARLEAEHLVETKRLARRPLEAEKRDAVAVGADDTVAVEGENALVRAADDIGIGVEAHLLEVAELVFEQRALDLLGRRD